MLRREKLFILSTSAVAPYLWQVTWQADGRAYMALQLLPQGLPNGVSEYCRHLPSPPSPVNTAGNL